MDFDPAIFQDAPLGAAAASPCSPALPDAFEGVLIAAPERVSVGLSETPVVPVCGAFQLRASDASDAPLTLHVSRDGGPAVRGLAVVEGELDEPEIPPPPGAPEPSPEALANTIISGYFHIDAQAATGAFIAPGTYEIAADFAGVRSGPVTVVVARRPARP
ncbi:hypothetical protein [Rubrimonas cliftonensis]|uniref:Uncharacterized protein n=1 Tax=Rubrimonas cliftonensis TaxID=89524 RepID=A0A1H4DK04_9RHOB|nr:hypothetical protein [Rubrimonas cliftonensis]SEA72868.1 hypothetical protein SAMN05444370_11073 [Rubrimonas cliftonensis]